MKKIVFTGGGTLGHVMPNLYLREELENSECFYIGSSGIEKDKVNGLMKYYEIPSVKLVRGKIFKNLKIPFVLFLAIKKAKKILKEINPDIVFSKGGYVSLPVCFAAKMLKIPIVAHESDSSFGVANKIILKLCEVMFVNFKSLENKNNKIVYSGPIFSKEYENNICNYSNLNLDKSKPTLLVVCGSLGSKKINESLKPKLKNLLNNFNIIHITGKGNKTKSFDNYNSFEITNDMVNLYNISDLVLGRSGAGVTGECCFKKLPMLLVPLENKSTRGDQLLNAEYYKELGVAEIIRESDLNSDILEKQINKMFSKIDSYKETYKNLKQINGREKVIETIVNICDKKSL